VESVNLFTTNYSS